MKVEHKLLVLALTLGLLGVSINYVHYRFVRKPREDRLYYLLGLDYVRVCLYTMEINPNVTFVRAEEMKMGEAMIEVSADEVFNLIKTAKVIYWEESVTYRFVGAIGYNHYYINCLNITYHFITEVWRYY